MLMSIPGGVSLSMNFKVSSSQPLLFLFMFVHLFVFVLGPFQAAVNDVACSHLPTAPVLVSASADESVRTWDLKTGKCRDVLEGHDISVVRAPCTIFVGRWASTLAFSIWHLAFGIWHLALSFFFVRRWNSNEDNTIQPSWW